MSRRRLPRLPALDGLRAIALLAVMAFHAGFSWIRGGYLPLTAFFVLSGFLITALLLLEHDGTGRIDLRAFWARRARRLVPGALLAMALVAVYVALGARREMAGLPGDAIASLTWVVNWRFVLDGRTYADVFSEPSPLQHLWSLSVEEQFYVVLPLVAVACLGATRWRRSTLATVSLLGIVASVVITRAVHEPGDPPLRAYFGTDTRAAELLVGVLLACVLIGPNGLRRPAGAAGRVVSAVGAAALAGSVWCWFTLREFDDRLYEGGLVVIALLAAAVVAAATVERSLVSRVLGFGPLVRFGRISYGVYLFHWPLFLWLDEERTGLDTTPLFVVRLLVTVALAALSHRFVEAPILAGRLRPPVARVAWLNASTAVAACLVVVAAALPSSGTTLLRAGEREGDPPPPPPSAAPRRAVAPAAPVSTTTTAVPAPAPTEVAAAVPAAAPTVPAVAPAPPPTPPPTAPPPPPLRVMVVGDSMARNLAFGLQAWADATGLAELYDASVIACSTESDGMRYGQDGQTWPIPAACDWWKTDGAARVAEFGPDVVLVQIGTNEVLDREHPSWEGRRAPGDPVFDAYLPPLWVHLVDVLQVTGAPVVWSVPPCGRWDPAVLEPDAVTARMAVINGNYIPQVAAARSVVIADLDAQVCPNGQFSDTVMGIENARPDGRHFRDEVSVAIAEQWLAPLLLAAGGR